jgi:Fe-S oxidoreductase/FAD/FMN-containing dehydrogenase
MTGTDAIGARSLRYGRMRDNIAALDAVLAHGAEISFGELPESFGHYGAHDEAGALILDLLEMAERGEAAIRTLPDTLGALPGYNLRALLQGDAPQNLAAFLAGSEGTLAIARRIELKLARLPRSRALGVCRFASLAEALRAVPAIAALEPTAIELTDRCIMDLGLAGRDAADPAHRVIRKDEQALVFVEFMEGNRVSNARKLKEPADRMAQLGAVRAVTEIVGAAVQDATQRARSDGIARLYGVTASPAAFAPIGEFALPVGRLAEAVESLTALFSGHDLRLVWHGQASAGALHMRPWLPVRGDLAAAGDIAAAASARLAEFAGQLASAEGEGIARSHAMQAGRDPKLAALFEAVKLRFDPRNRLNPGKIVFPAPPDPIFWRSEPAPETAPPLAALACDGTGLCRRLEGGVMCPSFRVTRDERDSPRGRANTLRLVLGGQLGADALASDAMAEAMQLCVSCKACRSECPRGADIAAAKIAVQHARVGRNGLAKFDRSAAFLPHSAPRLRRWRHLLNLRDLLPWSAALSERLTGFSADRPWPRWTSAPFAAGARLGAAEGPELLLFADTFNSHFDAGTLRAAVDVLTASGFRLHLLRPREGERPLCCGRTFLEAGLIEEARAEVRRLIEAAKPFTARGVPLVGLEPACLLTIRDEAVTLLAEPGAAELSAQSLLFEEVMTRPDAAAALQPGLRRIETEALIAPHCHQHAFGTVPLARKAAGLVPGLTLIEAEKSCCGMGTCFGYRPETVATSLRMGELALFPQIRRTGRDTLLIADGFACRRQISDGTGRTARHTAVLLKLALAAKQKFGDADEESGKKTAKLAKRLSRLRRSYFK